MDCAAGIQSGGATVFNIGSFQRSVYRRDANRNREMFSAWSLPGRALPLGLPLTLVLIALLALAAGSHVSGAVLFGEVALGIALGIIIPWLAVRIARTRFFSVAVPYQPFDALAIGLLVLLIVPLTHANEFLAAFFAGLTIACRQNFSLDCGRRGRLNYRPLLDRRIGEPLALRSET